MLADSPGRFHVAYLLGLGILLLVMKVRLGRPPTGSDRFAPYISLIHMCCRRLRCGQFLHRQRTAQLSVAMLRYGRVCGILASLCPCSGT